MFSLLSCITKVPLLYLSGLSKDVFFEELGFIRYEDYSYDGWED